MAFTYNNQEKRWYNNGQRIRLGNRIKNSDGSYLQLNSDGTSTKLYDDKTKRFTRGANNKLLVNRQDMDNIKAQHVFQNNKWRNDSVASANRPYIQSKPQIIKPNNVNPNISTDDNDTFLDKNHTLRKLYHKYAPKDTDSNFMKNINLAYDDIINYSNRNWTPKGRLRAMGDQARFINHGLAAIIGAPLNSILPESSKETIGQIGSVLDPSKLINTAGYAVRNGSWRAPWDKNNTGFLDRSVFGDGWGDTGTRQDWNDIGNAVVSVVGLKGAGSAAKGAVSGIRSASKIGAQAAKDVVTSGVKTAAKNTVKNISQAKDLDFVPVLSNIRSGSRMARNIKNTFSPIRTTQALGARKYLGNVAAPMWHYTMAADPMSFMYAGNPVSMKTYSLGQYKNGGQLIPKHQLGKVIKLIERVPELAKKAPEVFERASEAVKPAISFGERAFNKAKNFVNGTAQATKEWNAQAGKKALVNKNGNFDNRFLWVRQAEHKALQAGRNAFNDFSKNIAEADKTYLNAKQRSYKLTPEMEQGLSNAKQTAYNTVKNNAIVNRANQIKQDRINNLTYIPRVIRQQIKKHPIVSTAIESSLAGNGMYELYNQNSADNIIGKDNTGHSIFINYPNFKGSAENAIKVGSIDLGGAFNKVTGLHDNYLPVGHAATILVDNNGKSKYIEYGRYDKDMPYVIGSERRNTKGGNWRVIDLPNKKSTENDSVYMRRIESLLPDTKTGDYTITSIPNVDTDKAYNYVISSSNDSKREQYNITHTCAVEAKKLGLDFRVSSDGTCHAFDKNGYDQMAKVWSNIPGTSQRISESVMSRGKTYNMNKLDK